MKRIIKILLVVAVLIAVVGTCAFFIISGKVFMRGEKIETAVLVRLRRQQGVEEKITRNLSGDEVEAIEKLLQEKRAWMRILPMRIGEYPVIMLKTSKGRSLEIRACNYGREFLISPDEGYIEAPELEKYFEDYYKSNHR